MDARVEDIGSDWAFERYEAIRSRLPKAEFQNDPKQAPNLASVAPEFDCFILDAFGVLNRGETAIPGSVERMEELRRLGKKLIVLTNAASYTPTEILAKYRRLGFDFGSEEVISSRDLALATLPKLGQGLKWAAIAAAADRFDDTTAQIQHVLEKPELLEAAGGFIYLSSARWSDQDNQQLATSLRVHSRPVIVANPDLVAPHESGLTIEPGSFAHRLIDEGVARPMFFGKPYQGAFEAAIARVPDIPRDRIAMVGDTLHTDILGGKAAGIGTVLVSDHGLFRGRDVHEFIRRSGITPDWIVPTT